MDRFFATLRRSPVTRSQDRVIAGVSAGVADRLGVSRAIIRVAMVALGLLGPGVLLYLLAWLMMPDSEGRIRLERAVRGGEAGSIVLLVVAVLSVFSTLFDGDWERGPGMHGHNGGLWPLLVLGVVAFVGFKKGWFTGRRQGAGGHWGQRSQGQAPATPATPATPTTPTTPTTPPAPTATPDGPQDSPRA